MSFYTEMVGNLAKYLDKDIIGIKSDYTYPAGMLGDVRIDSVHYETF